MCFTEGKKSTRHYYEEAARPSRPVAPVQKADRWEYPRKAPIVPPNPQARKKAESHSKKVLRDADRVESNREKKRFATSNGNADRIRERALAKAREDRDRAARPLPPLPLHYESRPATQSSSEDETAYPEPLNIRKKDTPKPQPKPQPQQHRRRSSVRREELGNTVPASRNAAKRVDQSHIQLPHRLAGRKLDLSHIDPALMATPAGIHPALRTGPSEIHPALRNLPPAPSSPRRPSDQSQSSIERHIFSYLGDTKNYADSPRESVISPVNVAHKLPYASSRKRR